MPGPTAYYIPPATLITNTNHAVQIGSGTSNSFTQLAPSTNLYPVVSKGSSVDPAFINIQDSLTLNAPLPVGSGGTGVPSVPANNILIGSGGGKLGIISVVTPSLGGTGASSFPARSIILGNGSSTFDVVPPTINLYPVVSNSIGPVYANNIASLSLYAPLPTGSGGTGLINVSSHAILIGSGGGSVSQVLPPSTAGYSFISYGSSFDPAYGITPVAGGGIGQSNIPSNTILIGNAGNPVQLVPPVQSGFIFTDNGPGSPPSFQQKALSLKSVTTLSTVGLGLYTVPAGIKSIMVECVGGGGGSGGCGASSTGIGGSGGGGGYVRKFISNPNSSFQYRVGTAGTAGSNSGAGGNGGNTTFSDGIITLPAGGGGLGAAAVTVVNSTNAGGAGGTATGGDLNLSGEAGKVGFTSSVTTSGGSTGNGGNCVLGNGAPGNNTSAAGVAGNNYGGGASGAFSVNNGGGKAGAAGGQGVIYILEFS